MHEGDYGCRPFPSVFHPDAAEPPNFVFTFSFWAQIEYHKTLREVLTDNVNLTIGLPCVIAKYGLAFWRVRELLACSEKFLVRDGSDIMSMTL